MIGQVIGYTAGIFDLFHVGHLRLLQTAREYCDYLVVDVMSDAYSVQVKGKLPVIAQEQRLEIINGLECVCAASITNNGNTIARAVKWNAGVIFKGSDWAGTAKWVEIQNEAAKLGIPVRFFPYTETISSTQIVETIARRTKR